jgi:hypothetical protein
MLLRTELLALFFDEMSMWVEGGGSFVYEKLNGGTI